MGLPPDTPCGDGLGLGGTVGLRIKGDLLSVFCLDRTIRGTGAENDALIGPRRRFLDPAWTKRARSTHRATAKLLERPSHVSPFQMGSLLSPPLLPFPDRACVLGWISVHAVSKVFSGELGEDLQGLMTRQ